MKVKAKIYKQSKDKLLRLVGEGFCLLTSPIPKKGEKHTAEPYISINLGEYRIHLDRKDLIKFCKRLNFGFYV